MSGGAKHVRLGSLFVALALFFAALPTPAPSPPPSPSGLFAPGPELVSKAGLAGGALAALALAAGGLGGGAWRRTPRARLRLPPPRPERRRYLFLSRLLLEGG